MSRIVYLNGLPRPFKSMSRWLGSHLGVLGASHPMLPDYLWVEWREAETLAPARWSGDRPAEGYYRRRDLTDAGTMFIE